MLRQVRWFWLLVTASGVVACTAGASLPAKPAVTTAKAPATMASARRPAAAKVAAPESSAAAASPPAAVSLEQALPVAVLDSAPDGRWIAYCAADHDANQDGRIEVSVAADGTLTGDPFEPRLLIATHEPLAIDELVARDSSGRF
ncbi:MAG TPA: hypothetical protein VGP93_00210, partial [Polyangiaceae bacterium]|nr:hypothetical protein [Polyangiaceae bacterium]